MNIVIDGNISSGKTTQLDLLEKIVTKVKREPIDEWPLDLYYSDPERWGLAFQMIALQTRKKEECDCIYERCPYSSMNIFWPLMKKTEIEDRVYQTAYEKDGWGPDVYIFIDKKPEKCFEHITQRNQTGDSGVSFEYLKQLDTQYQKMYEKLDCKKFKIDGNQKVLNVHDQIVKILKENCRDIINV